MKDQRYQLKFSVLYTLYEFTSEGPLGRIPKIVKYTKSNIEGIYNLGFGDKLGDTDDFDDETSWQGVSDCAKKVLGLFSDYYTVIKSLLFESKESVIRVFFVAIVNKHPLKCL